MMVRIVYRVVIKAGSIEAFTELAESVLIPEAQKIQGCKQFSLFQDISRSQEFVFVEQWESKEDVHDYKRQLIVLLGDPRPGEEFPKKLNDLIEEDEDII